MKIEQLSEKPVGAALLAIALLIERFLPANNWLDFISGFWVGLSVVLNLKYIFSRSKRTLSC